MNDHFTTLSLLIHLNYPGDVVITINNSAIIYIVIIFDTTSKLLGQKSQSGIISLTLFIEIVDKVLSKYEAENIRWWYMTNEHGKQ